VDVRGRRSCLTILFTGKVDLRMELGTAASLALYYFSTEKQSNPSSVPVSPYRTKPALSHLHCRGGISRTALCRH
jgi:hypothetical protein